MKLVIATRVCSIDGNGKSIGEESFDGVWFGEKHPTEEGSFWWRKHLRQFINDNQALRIHDIVGRSEQLPCPKCGDYGTIDNQDGTVSTCPCHY